MTRDAPICFQISIAAPVEAWWKQEGENRDVNLRKTELNVCRPKSTKLLKTREKKEILRNRSKSVELDS